MRIYIAAKWEEREFARDVATLVTKVGHTITYPWWDSEQLSPEQAVKDYHGVLQADVVIFLAERSLAYKGAFVEMGIALGRGIPVVIVGSGADGCIFSQLPVPLVIKCHLENLYLALLML